MASARGYPRFYGVPVTSTQSAAARATDSPVSASVCVTGAHRSGTSMVARLLHLCGLWLGPEEALLPPASDNPEGFWEHERVVEVDDDILRALGGAWDCLPSFADGWATDDRLGGQRAAARSIVAELGTAGWWGFKDPRACLTLPLWLEVVPSMHVVLCLRNPLEVATSLHERNAFSYAFGLRLWSAYLHAAAGAAPADQRLVTHFDAYFAEPETELARVLSFAGRPADDTLIGSAVRSRHKGHRHSRFGWQDLVAAGVSPDIRALYESLCEEAEWWDDADHLRAGRSRSSRHEPTPATRAVVVVDGSADGSADAEGQPVGVVDGQVVDYRLLRWRYLRRGGQIAIQQRRIRELEAELATAHDTVARTGAERDDARRRLRALDLDLLDAAAEAALRFDGLEAAVLELSAAGGRDVPLDAAMIHALLAGTTPSSCVLAAIGRPVPARLCGRRLLALPAPVSGPETRLRQVEALRANGAEFLLASGEARSVEGLLVDGQLAGHYIVRATAGDSFTVDLRHDIDASAGMGGVIAEHELRFGRTPSILSWVGAEVVIDSRLTVASAAAGADVLDHADDSFDIVVIPRARPDHEAEAARVGKRAVVVVDGEGDDGILRAAARWHIPVPSLPRVAVAVAGLAEAADPLSFLRMLFEGVPSGTVTSLLVAGPVPAALLSRIEARFGGVLPFDAPPGLDAAGLAAMVGRVDSDMLVSLVASAAPVGPWLSTVVRTLATEADVVCGRHMAFDGTLLAAGGVEVDGEVTAVGSGGDADGARFRHLRRVGPAAGPALAVRLAALDLAPLADASVVYQPEWELVDLTAAPSFSRMLR